MGDQDLDIQIGEAKRNGLINLEWNDNSTILTMTTNDMAFTLQPDNEYQLRMVINKAKAAAEDDEDVNGNGYLDTGEDINNDGVLQSVLPLILGGSIDLLSGFTFTTSSPKMVEYPEVLWVTPTPDATNVPTEIYLELGFSQPMAPASVEASTLRVTDVSGGNNGDQGLDIQIGEAKRDGLINLEWNDNSTILTMTTNDVAFTLQPDNEYQLRMVVNKAKAAAEDDEDVNGNGYLDTGEDINNDGVLQSGLPLILGGSIDLLSGFTFTTSSPKMVEEKQKKKQH